MRLRDINNDREVDIRIGSGCFMLLRGNDYKEVGGFDDRYFMYFEDYDLCVELNRRNKRVVYTPFSQVIHYYERGAHKNSKLFKIFMTFNGINILTNGDGDFSKRHQVDCLW